MPTLFVLRHAKSSWNNSLMSDHERPLAPRGVRAAELLATHIAALEGPPALVLCSSARRAQETLEPVRERLPAGTEVTVEDDLYGASALEIVARLQQVPDGTPSVMVVGHNPGLEDLVVGLAADSGGERELVERVRAKFPTGAFATLGFDGSWKELRRGAARLEAFVVPADLAAGDLE